MISDDEISWEELCQKFAKACGPNLQIRCSYVDSTGEFVVSLWVRLIWETNWTSVFRKTSSPREAAYEVFFKKIIVHYFKDDAKSVDSAIREVITCPCFSSEEELILKLSIM